MEITKCPTRYAFGYKPLQALPLEEEVPRDVARVNNFNKITRIKKEQYKRK